MREHQSVLLVLPPFAPTYQPSLGLGRLKAQLESEGIRCDCQYINLDLLELMGEESYYFAAERIWLSELLYAAELFPDHVSRHRFVKQSTALVSHRGGSPRLPSTPLGMLRTVREFNRRILRHFERRPLWTAIGISANFHLLPALYFAASIKHRHPEIPVILGGSQCIGAVGAAIARTFPFLNWVIRGEAESSLPEVMHVLRHSSAFVPAGTCRRSGSAVAINDARRVPVHLNSLPDPNYEEYFQHPAPRKARVPLTMAVEASRGCWWRKCFFCSETDSTLPYRRISDDRVVQMMEHLADRHGCLDFSFCDDIQPTKVDGLAHAIAGSTYDFAFTMALRPDIPSNQLEALALAGLKRCLFGVESFSTSVLKRIGKGTDCLTSVFTLREARRLGVAAHYNIISPLPFETTAQRQRTKEVISRIPHLGDVATQGPFVLTYGSAAYHNPQQYGIRGITASKMYGVLLPPRYRFRPTVHWDYQPMQRMSRLIASGWAGSSGSGPMEAKFGPDGFCIIYDGRGTIDGAQRLELSPVQSAVVRRCLVPRELSDLNCARAVRKRLEEGAILLRDGARVLTLAVPSGHAMAQLDAESRQ